MLRDLRIRNLGVIEDASLRLSAGLNVLTGETGAGKTMVVDVVARVAGSRHPGPRRHASAADRRVADRHFIVDKRRAGGAEVTAVRPVEGADRVRELSRMLAGMQESGSARAHAEELLAAARSVR